MVLNTIFHLNYAPVQLPWTHDQVCKGQNFNKRKVKVKKLFYLRCLWGQDIRLIGTWSGTEVVTAVLVVKAATLGEAESTAAVAGCQCS